MSAVFKRLLSTDETNVTLFAQRTLLGAVIFPHGAQKLLGWFGGYGVSGTIEHFVSYYHVPAPIAFLVILGESIGALMLVLGFGTRFAAFSIALIMLGAGLTHVNVGFFMNWFGNQPGEGFEYHLLALALAVPVMLKGAGRFALDGVLRRRLSVGEEALLTPKPVSSS